MKKSFKIGDVVYERIRPTHRLIVSHYLNNVYFCKTAEDLTRKDLVYFGRELVAEAKPELVRD